MAGLVIEGVAMVSADGMLADFSGAMPEKLKMDADQRFFEETLDNCAAVVHGRKSWETLTNSAKRRRLVVTRSVPALKPHPDYPNVRFWNPKGVSLQEACADLGVTSGLIGILGGTDIFEMFLGQTGVGRYDTFWLSQTTLFDLPGGVPVFAEVPTKSPQQVLSERGFAAGAPIITDAKDKLTITPWRKI
jgi:dihydrofolate reductase